MASKNTSQRSPGTRLAHLRPQHFTPPKRSLLLLENLQPAPKVETAPNWRPAIEFDGTQGEATTLTWELLKRLSAIAPVTYASIGSNHCQFRVNKQRVGTVTDDWGVHIGRTLARLSQETNLGARFLEPHPHDESLIIDVFGDSYHRLGLVHGHQANRPEGVVTWWQKQSFGQQPVSSATILASGHFHHLRVQEVASHERGASRYWIQAATLDNGSDWYRLTSGEDSQPGVVCFTLNKGQEYTGTVIKL